VTDPDRTSPAVADLLDLRGRVALVTGANGGIGAAIARRLHEAGARVALHVHHATDRAEALATELGDGAALVRGDVVDDAVRVCDDTIAAFGRLDVLVNNAALQPVSALTEMDPAELHDVLRVNVEGVARLTQVSVAHLRRDGGAVVNIASIEGIQPAGGHSHYTASKAAVIAHTRAAALELGRLGVRVNAVAPGLVHREGLEEAWPEGVARWHAACPLGRLGQPDDVADAVLFLASPAARWISGACLVVDGGVLSRSTW